MPSLSLSSSSSQIVSQRIVSPRHSPASHMSSPVHGSPSSHSRPSSAGMPTQAPVSALQIGTSQSPTGWSVQSTTVAGFKMQYRSMQATVPLQRSPSSWSAQSLSVRHSVAALQTPSTQVRTEMGGCQSATIQGRPSGPGVFLQTTPSPWTAQTPTSHSPRPPGSQVAPTVAGMVAQAPASQMSISQGPAFPLSAHSMSETQPPSGQVVPSQFTASGALGSGVPRSSYSDSHPQAERTIVTIRTNMSCLMHTSSDERRRCRETSRLRGVYPRDQVMSSRPQTRSGLQRNGCADRNHLSSIPRRYHAQFVRSEEGCPL